MRISDAFMFNYIVLDNIPMLSRYSFRGCMRVIGLLFVLLLCCVSTLLMADNIPLISESMYSLGDAAGFKMYGDYALFVGGECHLQVMDFSDAEHPRLVAGCNVPGQSGVAKSISIYDHYAYLFFSSYVAIISISNPLSPQFMTRMDMDYTISQSIHNDVLYTTGADLSYHLKAYSLSNPIAPQLLDSLQVNYYPFGIACGNGWLVCGSSVVDVVNTSDPANLQLSSELHFDSGLADPFNAAFAFSGNNLVVGCGYFVSVYDFSQEPILRATLPLGFQVSENKGYIHNNRFWCKFSTYDDGSGIVGVDFSNPDSPQICFSQTYNVNGIFSFNMDEWLMTLRTDQNSRCLNYSNLDDNSLPSFELNYPLDSVTRIVSQGDWTVGINSGIMQTLAFDAGGTAHTQYIIDTHHNYDITLHDNTLLYTVNNEPYQNGLATRYLVMYDLISNTKKAELALGYGESSGEITLEGEIAYICNGLEGLFVVDISDVEHPVLLSQLQENIRYQCAVANNGKLWVGSDYSIRCYELRQSITPEFIYEIPLYMQTPFIRPYKMLMLENYLYAISTSGYLIRIKLGLSGAEEIKIYQTRYPIPTCIDILGAGLLIGSCDGLSVINVQDPDDLKEVAYRDVERVVVGTTGFIITSYAINGDRIYVGRGKSLQVLDASLAKAFTYVHTPEAEQKLTIYPNPSKNEMRIICKLPEGGTATLELYNLRGQKLFTQTYNTMNEGMNMIKLAAKDESGRMLSSGVYFLRVKQGAHVQTGRVLIVK